MTLPLESDSSAFAVNLTEPSVSPTNSSVAVTVLKVTSSVVATACPIAIPGVEPSPVPPVTVTPVPPDSDST